MSHFNLRDQTLAAKIASRKLALLSTNQKNEALAAVADALRKNSAKILKANVKDLDECRKNGFSESLLDRIALTKDRLENICRDIENVIELEDYVGQIIDERTRPNGLRLQRVRVPLGVVLMIYESRPNVTVDAAVLALKSGNAIILRGGKEAFFTNQMLAAVMRNALEKTSVSPDTLQLIETTDRSAVDELLSMKDLIDVVIPRGGKGLIDHICKTSHIPVIETGSSPVHVYIDEFADLEKAVNIAFNSKTRRVSICNTLDVLLVHEKIAKDFFPLFVEALAHSPKPVELRSDEEALDMLKLLDSKHDDSLLKPLNPLRDYDTEYLDYILAVHIVKNFDEALEHIYKHSRGHSESIVTENKNNAERFLNEVDSACVYVNASTQFSDGAQFGLGAEIGISTQKLHVRGPFALEGLTTYKWKIYGDGQTRS